MMKLLRIPFTLITTVFLCGMPASAHHAVQAQFDVNSIDTFTGMMTKVEFINPHPYFYLDVEGDDGQITNWEIESVALNALRRMGLVKELRVGLEYTVEYHPARNGESQGLMMAITLPGGNRLLMRNAE
ncbi:MAG: DUF6152 family protein [Candidatus Rariloculaceae bacterium]|tara:strand:+ start:687 stop:1073 length:387 start_codon:yes stop_codon:yes gene_type:complete